MGTKILKKRRNSKTILWLSIIILVILLVMLSTIFKPWIENNKSLLEGISAIITIVGIIGIILAISQFYQTERARKELADLEKTKLINDFMGKFYEPKELEELRSLLRKQKKYEIPSNDLKEDEVRMMNLFESLALTYKIGYINIEDINIMFGTVLTEIKNHPTMSRLVETDSGYSYEVTTDKLLPDLKKYRDKLGLITWI